jgi:hypothetical protein
VLLPQGLKSYNMNEKEKNEQSLFIDGKHLHLNR